MQYELEVRDDPNALEAGRMRRFIEALRKTGSTTYAMGQAGCKELVMLEYRKRWPEFDELCEVTKALGSGQYAELLSDAAWGRGIYTGQKPRTEASMFLASKLDKELVSAKKDEKSANSAGYIIVTSVPVPVRVNELPKAE